MRILILTLTLAGVTINDEVIFCLKTHMKDLNESFKKIESYSPKDFKNKKKIEEITEEINKIHRLSHSVFANEQNNDEEWLKIISNLIAYNRQAKDATIHRNYANFETAVKRIKQSCNKCHEIYK
jgi:tetrahydrodipicolinate N-succinyltransferase